ncbi:MAG: cytochrome c maturation protein CcmE [Desulfovibrio sp.]|jgi:cytochrome c-type biogenesis protein CcmE|nr:cytochrome c maturation protein CcmE [Desulfovibrio sp.]
MQKKSGKKLYLIAFLLFLGGVSYLVVSEISANSVYFLNVSEALTLPSDKLQAARLFGTVREDGITRLENRQGVKFQLEDKDNAAQSLWVEYEGPVPDTFKAGAEVIVEGRLDPKASFRAQSLMTKCPSKYQKENRS